MKVLLAGVALSALVIAPALAQSYQPDLGTGNINPPGMTSRGVVPNYDHAYGSRAPAYAFAPAYDAYAWVPGFSAHHWRGRYWR